MVIFENIKNSVNCEWIKWREVLVVLYNKKEAITFKNK